MMIKDPLATRSDSFYFEREIDAFTHMLWMEMPEMVVVIYQAALRDAAGWWPWKAVSAHELGI